MALGGGTFITQNKVLPGTYINFISAARAGANLSDRGIVAIPLELDWGAENEVLEVSAEDVAKDSYKLFGRDYTDDKLYALREVFKGAKKALLYRINAGGEKATKTDNSLTVTAKCSGERGNDIRVIVQKNVDETQKFDVITYIDTKKVDLQTVKTIQELQENEFVKFSGTGELHLSAGIVLAGGTSKAVQKQAYTEFLDKIESYFYHILVYSGTDDSIKSLFVEFTKRLRDSHGIKFQTVLYKKNAADYEGIISVENKVLGDGSKEGDLTYWVAGKQAGCPINRSLSNTRYDGELQVEANFKQSELEKGIREGKLLLHKVDDTINVLDDINTFTSFTVEKNEDFAMNQVVRVLDQDALETALIFNKRYLGKIQNNQSGRIAFWNEIVSLGNEMQKIGAIEGFESKDIVVEAGKDKRSVVVTKQIQPTTAMTKLYVTTVVE